MSETLTVGIANAEKGTNQIKELTGAELTAHLAAQAQAEESNKAIQDKIAADDAAKKTVLTKLGLTQLELDSLLGTTKPSTVVFE
jgi:hypothetical protein